MWRWQFITFLGRPNFGWPQYVRAQHSGWVHVIVGIAYILSLPSSLSQELMSQDIKAASGQQVFNNACRTCHTIKAGDNRLGPSLYKIIGRKAGSLPNYNYSGAMKGAGFVWDEQKMEHFIVNPDEVVPSNNMKPYGGLASTDDAKKVIAFLLSATAGGP
jgi:cytochrome c